LKEFGVEVDYINRFRSAKEKTEIYKNLESGKIDLIIGTHAILNKKIKFKDLGLLIIDEEQKFGVSAKEKLRNLAVNVDTLTLTATPIPRTLQFSLMAARDLSIMRTPPPNRQPIHTERRVFNEALIREAIYYEINRGGQVFFVHNRVKTLADITSMIKKLCPDVDISMAHGQMEADKLEKTLVGFIEGKFDVLVCTNIIETGLDIPNANTMIINNANQFGMADLQEGKKMHLIYTEELSKLSSLINKDKNTNILLSGAAGSSECFLIAAISQKQDSAHILIANDKEQAAYFQNTIDNLLINKKAYFFPDSFKRPMMMEEVNATNALQRTETINKFNIRKGKNVVLVTYPEAIFEKVVDPTILDKNKIEIEVNESLDVDTAIEVLVEFGFNRTEFVYEPGHFSIRGGIIDVFSYGNEWPYRIELFDDIVESIRTFNPTNQLSIRQIRKVNIIPDVNSKFKSEEKVSLFNVCDKNTVFWIQEEDLLLDKLQLAFEKSKDYIENLKIHTEIEYQEKLDERSFLYPKDVINQLSEFTKVFLSKGTVFKKEHEVKTQIKPQPAFNKNFNLLIEDLQKSEKEGFDIYIFSDNARQLERFYNIFEDLEANIKFKGIGVAIHEGFVDVDNRVLCYTDHQIFERFHRYKIREGFTKDQAMNLKMLRELVPGDYVTHIDHGVGKYSGLEKIDINGHIQESVRLIYLNNDVLYVSINSLHKISKYVGKDGTAPKLSKIGGDAWKNLKRKTKSKVKDIANELIKLYAKRKASKGFAFPPDGYLQNELEASFIYEDTPDQFTTTQEVKEDMSKPYPMDRLICGDVG
ncbi:unnamed protein product, partial [Cyprideis torosa]